MSSSELGGAAQFLIGKTQRPLSGRLLGLVSLPETFFVQFDIRPDLYASTFDRLNHSPWRSVLDLRVPPTQHKSSSGWTSLLSFYLQSLDSQNTSILRVRYDQTNYLEIVLPTEVWSLVTFAVDPKAGMFTAVAGVSANFDRPDASSFADPNFGHEHSARLTAPVSAPLSWPGVALYLSNHGDSSAFAEVSNLAIGPAGLSVPSISSGGTNLTILTPDEGRDVKQGELLAIVSLPTQYKVAFKLEYSPQLPAPSLAPTRHDGSASQSSKTVDSSSPPGKGILTLQTHSGDSIAMSLNVTRDGVVIS